MELALVIFIATYVLMFAFQRWRPYIALASALLFLLTGMLSPTEALAAVDYNVLMMIAGTMGTVSLMIASKMPSLLADLILEKVPNVCWAVVTLSLFAGIVSAFIDNVATVLMIAPIALEVAKRLKISPAPMIIAIAVSSNLQGAATLVGDTTSILLGGYAGMNFLDFFVYQGKAGIFFAVELGALCSAAVIFFLFRKEKAKVEASERTKVEDYVPTVLLALTVLLLIGASLIPDMPPLTNGIICMGLMVVGVIYNGVRYRTWGAVLAPLKEIDYQTVLLLFSLFIVVGGIGKMGVVAAVADLFTRLGGGNLFLIYTLIVWGSVLFSAFIDNIPYVATMLPVVQAMALSLGIEPTLLYFGLLSGATLGGNLTPIGASANITAIGLLRKEGCEVKNATFMKIGVPATLAAVVPAYLFFWFLYA